MALPKVVLCRTFSPAWSGIQLPLYFEYRISNKEFRTAEVFRRSKTMFFTSIFCGSAVYILNDLIADS
jgi:hypothetical protein